MEIAFRGDAGGGERLIQDLPQGRTSFELQAVSVLPGLSAGQRAACVRDLGGS